MNEYNEVVLILAWYRAVVWSADMNKGRDDDKLHDSILHLPINLAIFHKNSYVKKYILN